jgi:hypothetical protein
MKHPLGLERVVAHRIALDYGRDYLVDPHRPGRHVQAFFTGRRW